MKNEYLEWNLEQALLKPERLILSDGQKPIEWHYFKKIEMLHLIMPDYTIRVYNATGQLRFCCNSPSYNTTESLKQKKLMLLPDIHTVWLNIFFDGKTVFIESDLHHTKETAATKGKILKNYVKSIPITNEPE